MVHPINRREASRLMLVPTTGGMLSITTTTTITHQLVRRIFLRALAFIYGIAFTVAYRQNKALIGDNGLSPARDVLDKAEARGAARRVRRREWLERFITSNESSANNQISLQQRAGFWVNSQSWYQNLREALWDRTDASNRPVTTLLWLANDRSSLNPWLDRIALTGIITATVVGITGTANVPAMLALWLCQRSLWAVGGPWYGYGWEAQLAELGFHALFLVPMWNPNQNTQVPMVVIWAIRWFLFRIMMGAGLIKIKGAKSWKDLTAMYYHYETQPVPNPLSKYFHFLPKWWHRGEVLTNHFVELVAPWLLLIPNRAILAIGGLIQLIFQATLILSGNLSFLNWLTAIPAIFCFNDSFFKHATVSAAAAVHAVSPVRRLVNVAFAILITRLSVPVVQNLCSRKQIMNGSFDPLRLVNTYGAFGTVSEERVELVVSSAQNIDQEWREYEFPVKPCSRPPRWISPYHYRLDWQLWIAALFRDIDSSPWMYTFLAKLLERDREVQTSLLQTDPWKDDAQPPLYIRVDRYRYTYRRQRKSAEEPYWDREYLDRFYPRQGIASLATLQREIEQRQRRN